MARRPFLAQWLWNGQGDPASAGADGDWALPMFSRSTRLDNGHEDVADENTDSAGSGHHHDEDQACEGHHDGPSDETDDDQAVAPAEALPQNSHEDEDESEDEEEDSDDNDDDHHHSAGSGDHHDEDQACQGHHDGPSDETDDDQAVAPAEASQHVPVVTTARFAESHSEENEGAISDDQGDVPLDQSPDGDLGAVLNGWEGAFAKARAAVEASLSGEQPGGAHHTDGESLSGDCLTGCLQNVIDGGWALVNDLEESLSNWLGGQPPSAYLGEYLRDRAPDSEFLNRTIPDIVQQLFAMAPQALGGESCVIGNPDYDAQVPLFGGMILPWIAGAPSGSPASQPLDS